MKDNHCPKEDVLVLFSSEDLGPAEQSAVAEHITHCQECEQSVAEFRATLEALPKIDLELTQQEQAAFASRVTANLPKRRFFNLQNVGAAATTVAAGILAVYIFNPVNMSQQQTASPQAQLADIELVENFEMLDNLDLLVELELLEMLDDKG